MKYWCLLSWIVFLRFLLIFYMYMLYNQMILRSSMFWKSILTKTKRFAKNVIDSFTRKRVALHDVYKGYHFCILSMNSNNVPSSNYKIWKFEILCTFLWQDFCCCRSSSFFKEIFYTQCLRIKQLLHILCSHCECCLLLMLLLMFEHVLRLQDTLNVLDLAFNVCGFFDNTSREWQSFT